MPETRRGCKNDAVHESDASDITLSDIKALIEHTKTEILSGVRQEIMSLRTVTEAMLKRVEALENKNKDLELRCECLDKKIIIETGKFHDELEDVKSQATNANDFVLSLLKEKERKVECVQADLKSLESNFLRNMNEVKLAFTSMQNQIAFHDLRQRKKSFVIRNFPEKACVVKGRSISSCEDAVEVVAQALGLENECKNIKNVYRLGKMRADHRPRLIMVKASEKTVNLFLRKARLLKQAGAPLNRVFVQENLPPDVSEKLASMRKRAYEHRQNHPGEEAFVKNRKLFINGTAVDEAKPVF